MIKKKFKAYHKKRHEWLGVNLQMSLVDGVLWWQFGYECKVLPQEDTENIELLQYIERKDINEKELCEGDIVKWINNYGDENIGWIRYSKAMAGFNVVLIKGSYQPFYTGSVRNFGWSGLEIIGNICDNPELLGEKEITIFKHI